MKKLCTNSIIILSVVIYLTFSMSPIYAWQTPVIYAPLNGASSTAGSFKLDWNSVLNSAGYQLEIDTTPLFNSSHYRLINTIYIGASNTGIDNEYEYTDFFYGQMFYWRVRAYIANDTSVWTATNNNYIDINGPVVNGASPQGQTSPTFDWNFQRNVDHYDFEIDTTPQFNSPALRNSSKAFISNVSYDSDTRQMWANMYYGVTHYWRVRSRTAVDTSDWSDTLTYVPPATISGLMNQHPGLPAGRIIWNSHENVAGYEWELDTSANFNSSLLVQSNAVVPIGQQQQFHGVYFQDLYYGTSYYFRVRSFNQFDTAQWATLNFQTTPICAIYKPNNTINGDPSFDLQWWGHYNVIRYEYEVDSSPDFNSPLLRTGYELHGGTNNTSIFTSTVIHLYYDVFYYVRLRAIHSVDTSDWGYTTYHVSSGGPELVFPVDSALNVQPGLNLKWDYQYFVTAYDYQIDTTSSFNSSLLRYGSTPNGYLNTIVLAKDFYYGTTYYWRVRSRNNADTSDWSVTRLFTTTDIGPLLTAPANGSVGMDPFIPMDWNSHHYVHGYIWQADTSTLFNSAALRSGQTVYYDTVSTNIDTRDVFGNFIYYTQNYWRVCSYNDVDTSGWSQVWAYRISSDGPVLVSPANASVNTQPAVMLDWNRHNQSRAYLWEADTTLLFNSPAKQSGKNQSTGSNNSGTDTQIKIADLYYGSSYYWRAASKNSVDTSDWATPFQFTVTPVGPALVSPLDNAVNVPVNGTILNWNAHDSVSYYEVQLDTTSQFNSTALVSSISNYISFQNGNSDTEFLTSSLLPNSGYYWRVRSMNNVDTSGWTIEFHFSTAALVAPVAPLLVSPVDNTIISGLDTVLNWNAVPFVNYYELQVDTVSSFNSALFQSYIQNYINTSSNNLDTEKNVSGLLPDVRYYWRVNAANAAGSSVWSTIWSFVTPVITEVRNFADGEQIIVYPQPASDEMFIKADILEKKTIDISLMDCLGRKVLNQTRWFNNGAKINAEELRAGLYIMTLTGNGIAITKRVVIR